MTTMNGVKLAASVSIISILIAQEVPDSVLPEWGKLGVSAMCLAILGYLTLRTIPELFKMQLTSQETATKQYTDSLERLGAVHRETSKHLCDKMDEQTHLLQQTLSLLVERKQQGGK